MNTIQIFKVDQKDKAILILLSLGEFRKVIELLHSLRCNDRAALLIQACQQLRIDIKKNCDAEENRSNDADALIEGLKEDVFLEYSRMLLNYGMIPACSYFCQFAGSKGADMLNEINKLTKKSEIKKH